MWLSDMMVGNIVCELINALTFRNHKFLTYRSFLILTFTNVNIFKAKISQL